ncbi:MAG: myxosortase-dependent metalloprotease, MXAN_2677/MXAN_2678 family [Myxococcaceae bacterium]
MDVRVLAVLAAVAALVTGATVPYVRSRTDRNAPDGGHCLGWPAGPLEFRENAAGAPGTADAGFLAMEKSLATWATPMSACGNLSLAMGPRTTTRSAGFDDRKGATNENVLLFRIRLCSGLVPADDACIAAGSCANVYDCWDFDRGTLAITTTTYNVRTGRLYDADLEMNAFAHTFTTVDAPPCTSLGETGCVATDVQNTVTHELGHALGLDHAPDSRSTMFAGASLGEISKRVLDDGSVEFVCTVYRAGEETRDCDGLPLDLSETTASSCAAAPVGALGLLTVLLAAGRRRGGR